MEEEMLNSLFTQMCCLMKYKNHKVLKMKILISFSKNYELPNDVVQNCHGNIYNHIAVLKLAMKFNIFLCFTLTYHFPISLVYCKMTWRTLHYD